MTLHKWMVGLVLTAVMVTALGMNALLFSARDFQFGLAQVSPQTNGLVSMDRLVEVDAQVQDITAQTAEPRGVLLQLRSEIESIDNFIASTDARINQTRAEIAGGIAQVEANAQIAGAESAAAALDASALNSRVMALAGRSGLAPTDQQSVAALRGQVNELGALEESLTERDLARAELVTQERAAGALVAESDRRIFALQQSVVPEYEHYVRVRNEAFALLNASPLGVGAALAQWHPASLSTVLVLLMGALGAILYLFPAYLNRGEPVTFAEIAVRVIFGMCAALAFYMLANATISGFAISSGVEQASTSSSLNPFTVSLIGIVAGVLAEDIAKWIQDRGKGIFTQGVQAPTRDAVAPPAADASFSGVNPHGGPHAP
jgi:hypothetical protein